MSTQHEIVIKRRVAYSAIPDRILEDKRLSLQARAALGWMIGRPGGWVLKVEYMKFVLGISEKAWKKIRGELKEHGYYTSTRVRGVSAKGKKGVWLWETMVTDDPIYSSTTPGGESIPPIRIDGETERHSIPPASMDGGSMDAGRVDARGGDITGVVNTSVNKTINQPNQNHRPAPAGLMAPAGASAGGGVGGGCIENLSTEEKEHLAAANWQQQANGKPVCNEEAWRGTLLKRWRSGGFNARDLQTLAAWRLATTGVSSRHDGHSGFDQVDYLMGAKTNTMSMAEGVRLMRAQQARRRSAS